jgi:hypothetical protein
MTRSSNRSRARGRGLRRWTGAVLLAAVVAACGGNAPAADSPEGVVAKALDLVAAKDLDGLRELACAGQEDELTNLLGLPMTIGPGVLPGLNPDELVDAVEIDVSDVSVGSATIDGEEATVPLSGELGVTFDAEAMRPILREIMDQQGTSMTDEQLDALLRTLQTYGQAIPLDDQAIRLIREDGAWKVCQEAINP